VPEVLVNALHVESALVPSEGPEPEIHKEMRKLLSARTPIERKWRLNFYEETKSSDTTLGSLTGEQRINANTIFCGE
jgi:L-fucose mutarotase/ribose pyranase (RbsD/FucU family)